MQRPFDFHQILAQSLQGDYVALTTLTHFLIYKLIREHEIAEVIDITELEIAKNDARCNPSAIVLRGVMYHLGRGFKQDFLRAKALYERAMVLQHAHAFNNLGFMYEHGQGVEKDDQTALEYYEQAFAIHAYPALENLVDMYEQGKGCQADPERAFLLLHSSLSMNEYDITLHQLARMYRHGIGVTKDIKKAVIFYMYAVNQQYPNSMFQLGYMYHRGLGVVKNKRKALNLYERAIALGCSHSMIEAAKLYSSQEDPHLYDLAKAARLYRMFLQITKISDEATHARNALLEIKKNLLNDFFSLPTRYHIMLACDYHNDTLTSENQYDLHLFLNTNRLAVLELVANDDLLERSEKIRLTDQLCNKNNIYQLLRSSYLGGLNEAIILIDYIPSLSSHYGEMQEIKADILYHALNAGSIDAEDILPRLIEVEKCHHHMFEQHIQQLLDEHIQTIHKLKRRVQEPSIVALLISLALQLVILRNATLGNITVDSGISKMLQAHLAFLNEANLPILNVLMIQLPDDLKSIFQIHQKVLLATTTLQPSWPTNPLSKVICLYQARWLHIQTLVQQINAALTELRDKLETSTSLRLFTKHANTELQHKLSDMSRLTTRLDFLTFTEDLYQFIKDKTLIATMPALCKNLPLFSPETNNDFPYKSYASMLLNS